MKIFLSILIFSFPLFAQEIDITDALKEIEYGNIDNAKTHLQQLKTTSPNHPSVIFLDAVLTPDADAALVKFQTIYDKHPHSKYADAALYRIFSFHYALGYYKKADEYLSKLKTQFPNSPYIKAADRTIPDEDDSTLANEPQIEETKKDDTQHRFTIQAGAFLNAANAEKLKSQLNAGGFISEIKQKEIGGSLFNIVYVGSFENEKEALPVKEQLDKKYSLNVRIVNKE